jgi:hypothetical protein
MNTLRWEKHAPLTGIVAVVLWVVGFIVLQGPANQPNSDVNAARALNFFKDKPNAILLGTFLFMLGGLFFLWFLGSLRATLHHAEGGAGGAWRVATIADGGGLVTAVAILLMPATLASAAANHKHLSEGAAQALLSIGDAFFFVAELAAAVLLLGTALVVLRTGVLPRWLAWVSLVVALWLLIPPIGWAALILALPLWTVIVSVLLGKRPPPPPRPPHTAQFVATE